MPTLNWPAWYERWEAMQAMYLSQRDYRFELLLRWPAWNPAAPLRLLDLGCGPGSLALRAAQRFPQAEVWGLDMNVSLLAMGAALAQARHLSIRFIPFDLRQPAWDFAPAESFDGVFSATALHWLSREKLARVYPQIQCLLKPGGWFLNADHLAADTPELQARFETLVHAQQQARRAASQAEDWNTYWQNFNQALNAAGQPAPAASNDWEGTDAGYPRAFHLEALRLAGFDPGVILWQDLGDALIAAQKPARELSA